MAASAPSLSVHWSRYIPRDPYPAIDRRDPPALSPKQFAFLSLKCREAFYGGAAGGAKSDALIMAALQYVDEPGYAALLLRRTYVDLALPGAIMDRAKEWLLPQGVKWHEGDKQFTFPSGATVNFGYLEHERDKYRYQSSEFQFIGFDEVTQFTETQYRYMFSRLRRLEDVDIPLRMRAASNPDGEGFEWVRQRFIVEGRERGIVFIPATLEDNPYLDRDQYVESLNQLDQVTRQRLLHGDWDVRPAGGVFMWWPRYRPDELPKLREIVIPIDTALGGDDYTAAAAWGFDGSKAYLLDAMRYQGETPQAERRLQYFRLKIQQQHSGVRVLPLHRSNVHIDKIMAQHLRHGVPTAPGANVTRIGMPVGDVKLPSLRGTGASSDEKRLALGRMVSVEFEGGRALIPEQGFAGWLPEWLEEHIAFDGSGKMHDDWVETTIMALWHFFRKPQRQEQREPVSLYG